MISNNDELVECTNIRSNGSERRREWKKKNDDYDDVGWKRENQRFKDVMEEDLREGEE